LRAWQSFCTASVHVLFGLPLGLEPSTSYSTHFFTPKSVSSFRNTCPYHRNLFCCSINVLRELRTPLKLSVTGQLADTPTRGLPTRLDNSRTIVNSRTGQVADWTTRGLADAAKRTKTKHGESPVASASCPVRESSSPRVGNPRVGVSASCRVTKLSMVRRLREPEKEERKRFSMIGYKYRFTGRTQYQSQQAAEQISRSSQSVNRVAGDRFTWDRTLDPGQSALPPSLYSPAPSRNRSNADRITHRFEFQNRKSGFGPRHLVLRCLVEARAV